MLTRPATVRRHHSGRRIHHEQSRLPPPSPRRPLATASDLVELWQRAWPAAGFLASSCVSPGAVGGQACAGAAFMRTLRRSPLLGAALRHSHKEPATARGMAMSVRLVRAPHKNDITKDLVAFYVSIQGPWCKKDGPDCNLTYF